MAYCSPTIAAKRGEQFVLDRDLAARKRSRRCDNIHGVSMRLTSAIILALFRRRAQAEQRRQRHCVSRRQEPIPCAVRLFALVIAGCLGSSAGASVTRESGGFRRAAPVQQFLPQTCHSVEGRRQPARAQPASACVGRKSGSAEGTFRIRKLYGENRISSGTRRLSHRFIANPEGVVARQLACSPMAALRRLEERAEDSSHLLWSGTDYRRRGAPVRAGR